MNNGSNRRGLSVNLLLLGGIVSLLAFFLVFVHQSDLRTISNLADETLTFMESVCQRYDNYAAGDRTASLKAIFDKAEGLAEFTSAEKLEDPEFLRHFAQTQSLTGILVTDGDLKIAAQADSTNQNGYLMWARILSRSDIKDILQHKNKTFSGSATVWDIEYDLVVVARQDAEGLILAYAEATTPSTDIYESSLSKTLENNTFHKNPEIVITDGTYLLATNAPALQELETVSRCPITNVGDERWLSGDLVRLHQGHEVWYGKRSVYGKYYIYVFYPSGEVFTDMLPIVTTAIAVYTCLCLLLMISRSNAERRHQKREQRQIDTIRAINTLYSTSSILHLQENTLEVISSTPRSQEIVDRYARADDIIVQLAQQLISTRYRQKYIDFLDFSTMRERMDGKSNLAAIAQDVNGTWFSLYLLPMSYNEDGSLKDVLFLSRNINDYKQKEEQYQEELRRAARDAELANSVKSSFLRRMSHDVWTPINGIRGMASLAEKSLDNPDQARDYIHKILTSSEYLQSLLDNILRMSKLESGQILFEDKPYDLTKVIQDTAEFTSAQAENKGVQFTINYVSIIHTHVIGSPLHLRQVMQNLLSNAVKFNRPNGSVAATCREVSCQDGQMIFEFVCADTGIGMSKEFQSHLFEPFTQEGQSARSSYVGAGLGLSIVKEILDKRGGTIAIESAQGHGSTFTVTLPLKVDTSFAVPLPEETGSIAGTKVLVAEDNEINMEIVHYLLEDNGAIVTEAHNGREALEKFSGSPPGTFDVILMDIMMPEMDGLEATKHIRALRRRDASFIPIFSMTANTFLDDINHYRLAGMNEHLPKPLDPNLLISTIYKYCKKSSPAGDPAPAQSGQD